MNRRPNRSLRPMHRHVLFAAAFALAGLCAPALAAPDAAADLETIKGCLADAGEDARSCVGPISSECQALPEGQTSQGSAGCVERETAAWDALLNETYQAELAASESADADFATYPDADFEPVAESLKKAQRAWISYRDAECQRRYNLFQNGSYRIDVFVACELELTAERALSLPVSSM